jgi:Bax protein
VRLLVNRHPLRALAVLLCLASLLAGGTLLVLRGTGLLLPGAGPWRRPAPDFAAIEDPALRKEAFLRWLLPAVERENARVARTRRRLLRLEREHRQGRRLSRGDLNFLGELADRYRTVSPERNLTASLRALLRRVDTVPARLALVQAALESGWGTSRFAREANNYFGIWTWRHEGIEPAARAQDADHRVASYPDAAASVRAYLFTLDVGPAYTELRRLRAEARAANREPRALDLAAGLSGYSARGQDYVAEIRQTLRANVDLLDAILEES